MRPRIAGIVLAGGLSRRMGGGDKALRTLGGRSILDRVIARAAPQVEVLALNANGDPARFAETGLPVVPDSVEGFPGPLAGVLAGLEWARNRASGCTHVASFACDAPFLPEDLVERSAAGRRGGRRRDRLGPVRREGAPGLRPLAGRAGGPRFARPWSRRKSARSMSGRRATGWLTPSFPPCRSIRSST